MSGSDIWDVYAVKFGDWPERLRRENFIMADPHDGPGEMYFYVWAVTNGERTILVDLGFEERQAAQRGRHIEARPSKMLEMLGIEPAKVTDVVISHMHWDHAGTMDDFPNATFHIQDKEMQFVTGRCMCTYFFRRPFNLDDVQGLLKRVYEGKVKFHDGEGEVAPGVTCHLIGGHTMGVQAVRVKTKRGHVALASDSLHLYENMDKEAPFPTVYSVADMVAGYGKLKKLAETVNHVVPGHDPLVMDRYPAPDGRLAGRIARLDVMPKF